MRKHHKAAKTATTKKESLTPSTSAAQPGALVKAASSQTTIADQNDALSPTEETLLAECETDIEQNLQGAFVFGYRLFQIREQRLYRKPTPRLQNIVRGNGISAKPTRIV